MQSKLPPATATSRTAIDGSDKLAQGSAQVIHEPFYRIVCPAVYGGDWQHSEQRIGPGTFWTPRPDSILSMVKAIFVHHTETSLQDRESAQWEVKLYEVRDALMQTVDNWNVYGRACQQGERTLVETYGDPREIFTFHPKDYQSPADRIELYLKIEQLFGEPVVKFIDYSRGERILFEEKEAFVFGNMNNWKMEIAIRDGDWRFKVVQAFEDPEALEKFLSSEAVVLPAGFDASCMISYFWMDKENQRTTQSVKKVPLDKAALKRRRTRFISDSTQS